VANYPAASVDRDLIGRVPLHYALSNGATLEVVEVLINAAVQAYGSNANGSREICSVADLNGWLPIHVACFMGASARVLAILVKAFPEGVDMETKKNSTPLTLLRGISISPQKRDDLESILLRKKPPVKYGARISPARTDIDKVVRMSDETCSKGVTLEIDEDETSSLSSMEGTQATVRTGTTKKMNGTVPTKRQLQFGADVRRLDAPPEAPYTTSSPRAIYSSSLLPTHSAYGETPNHQIVPQARSRRSPMGSQASASTPYYQPGAPPQTDRMFPPQEGPVRRTMLNKFSSSMSRSSVSTGDSSAMHNAVFRPITPNAAFC